MPSARAVGSALSMPWAAFVALFVYYAVLTLVTIGGGDLSLMFVAASYLVPVALYLAALARRATRALSTMTVELWPVSSLVLH